MLFDTKITACPCSASSLGEKVEVVEKRGKSCPPLPCLKRVAWVGKFDGIATCGRSLEPRMAPYSRSLGSLPPVLSYNEKSTGLFRWVIDGMKTAKNSDPTPMRRGSSDTSQNCQSQNALLVPSDASQSCTPELSFARRDKIECD